MKILKSMCIMIVTISVIFMISGCQKDSVIPKQKEVNQTETAASKQKSKIQANHSDHQLKTETKTSDNKTNETDKKAESSAKKDSNKSDSSTRQMQQSTTTKSHSESTTSANSKSKTNNSNSETSNKQTNAKTTTKTSVPQSTVTISIISNDLKKSIVAPTKVSIKNGDTYLNVTRQILKQKGITISVRGSGSSAYVEGIGNLYEFDHGPLSGWIAKKNGVKLDRSAGIITVKNGDSIQWIYMTDYLKDNN